MRSVLQTVGDRAASFGGTPQAGSGVSHVVAEAYDAGGSQLAEVQLSGPEPYTLTAGIIAWAAQHAIEGTGALGPLQAYGLEALEAGVADAGLTRVGA